MTWISDIMDATAEVESPKSFIYWSSLAALSAILKKNVYLDKFYYKLYPNIYVMLVTDSGGRKGFPVWLAEQMVLRIDTTRFISGQNSIESIITQLSKAYSKEGGGIITDANAFIVSGEFHELLLENDSALTILTSLYDTHSRELWKKTTKSMNGGNETLKNVCLTLLGASNEALLRKAVPDHAIEGGFIGRMLVIPDDKSGIINALVDPPKHKFDVNELLPYLQIVSKLKGEFHYSPKGKLLYKEWYENHRKHDLKDKTGTLNRLHDQILKVAMLLSLNDGLNLIISEDHLDSAIFKVTEITQCAGRIAEGKGKAEQGEAFRIIIYAIAGAPNFTISKRALLRNYWGDFDSIILARAIDHFKEAGAIDVKMSGGEMYYSLSKEYQDLQNNGQLKRERK